MMNLNRIALSTVAASSMLLSGCDPLGTNETYTLYRNSPFDNGARIHVATFDAAEKEEYNRENCETAAELFGGQRGIVTRFWCEKGGYRR